MISFPCSFCENVCEYDVCVCLLFFCECACVFLRFFSFRSCMYACALLFQTASPSPAERAPLASRSRPASASRVREPSTVPPVAPDPATISWMWPAMSERHRLHGVRSAPDSTAIPEMFKHMISVIHNSFVFAVDKLPHVQDHDLAVRRLACTGRTPPPSTPAHHASVPVDEDIADGDSAGDGDAPVPSFSSYWSSVDEEHSYEDDEQEMDEQEEVDEQGDDRED